MSILEQLLPIEMCRAINIRAINIRIHPAAKKSRKSSRATFEVEEVSRDAR